MNYILSLCLLVSTSTTVAMEIVRTSSQERLISVEKIYSLFVKNQHDAAEKEIKANDNEMMALSLLKHGIKKNNANFIQWFLETKQLPSNDLALQNALEYSRNHKNEAVNTLNTYVQLQQEQDIYVKNELAKIEDAKREGWSARQAAPGENDRWKEKMKNAKPIPEAYDVLRKDGTIGTIREHNYITKDDDCRCIMQ